MSANGHGLRGTIGRVRKSPSVFQKMGFLINCQEAGRMVGSAYNNVSVRCGHWGTLSDSSGIFV